MTLGVLLGLLLAFCLGYVLGATTRPRHRRGYDLVDDSIPRPMPRSELRPLVDPFTEEN